MKKFIIAVMSAFCVVGAYAAGENERATSVGYVTEELETRQDKFNKLGADTAMTYSGSTDGAVGSRTITGDLGAETNTSATTLPTVGGVDTKLDNKQDELNFAANTVLMNTGTAGAPAAKGIYDDSGSYVEQTDSLIEAATFNAALQNAINSEFTCAQRKDPNDPTSKCLLFNIFTPTTNLIIPAEYTRLEYLESTGTQWIDTNYLPNNLTNFEIKYMHTAWNTSMYANIPYGCTDFPDGYAANNGLFRTNRGMYGDFRRIAWGNELPGSNITLDDVAELNNWYTDKYLQNKIYINNVLVATSSTPITSQWTASRTLWLFARNSTDPYQSIMRLGYAKAWEGDTQIFNMIPARRNSDNVLGMYDTVSGTFFTNAGSGTFIAGPELSSNIYLPMN